MKNLRVIVADFHQETNSFNPKPWSFEDFEQDTFLEGKKILEEYENESGRVLSGILRVLKDNQAEVIPSCAMRSTSGGPVKHEIVEYFLQSLIKCYKESKPVDAFIMGVHGATQSTEVDDVCGYILEKLREQIESSVVISIGCDMHGNITEKCVKNANFICGFQTYPHVDQYQTGVRAASLVFEKILEKKRYYLSKITLPMIVPASGYSTEKGPFKEIIDFGKELMRDGKLRDFSVFQMQPWLDVRPAGSSVLTISESPFESERAASRLAEWLFRSREHFWPSLYSIDETIDIAIDNSQKGPTVLVDFADSLGAGALGDSVAVVKRLQERKYPLHTVTIVKDKKAVAFAEEVGVGNSALFTVGSGETSQTQESVELMAKVVSIQGGIFYQEGPVGTGQRRNLGKTAVLSAHNIDLLVCEHPCGTGDLQVYKNFGINPQEYQLVVVKANTSFRAAYERLASKICMTDTPGIGTSNLKKLNYRRLPKKFYPFDSLEDYQVKAPQTHFM